MTTPDITPQPLEIEGRTFYNCTSTSFKQDIYVMSVMRKSGLEKLASEFDITKTDILDEVAQDIIVTASINGQLFEMLGAVLEEEGVPWTVESAKENAEFFAELRDKRDKDALHGAIVSVILGFFVSGLLSSKNLKNSLNPATVAAAVSPTAGIMLSNAQPVGIRTSEFGTSSSANSPDSTKGDLPTS
jgi:hypothetical protein